MAVSWEMSWMHWQSSKKRENDINETKLHDRHRSRQAVYLRYNSADHSKQNAGKKLNERAVISTEIKDRIKQTELFSGDGEGRYDELEGNKQKCVQNADSNVSDQNFQDLDARDVELHTPDVNCVEQNSSDAIALQCIAKDLKRQSNTSVPMNFQQDLTHQTSTSDYFSDKGTFCTVNASHEKTEKCNNMPHCKHQQNETILEQREDSCNSDSDGNADVTLVINDHDCCLPTISDNVNIQSLQEFQTRDSMESDTTLICNDADGNSNNTDVMNDHVQDIGNENFVGTLTSNPATEERITFSKYNRDLHINASSSVLTHQNKSANINVTSSGDTDFLVSLLNAPSINNSCYTNKSKTFYLSSNASKSFFSQDVQKVPIDVPTVPLIVTNISICEQHLISRALAKLGKFHLTKSFESDATHVICGGKRRTVNIVFAIAKGCWLLSPDWVFESEKAGYWLPENQYELADCFPTMLVNRKKRMMNIPQDLFLPLGKVYLNSDCSLPQETLRSLINLSGGKIVDNLSNCDIIVGTTVISGKNIVTQRWIIDCIEEGKLLPHCIS